MKKIQEPRPDQNTLTREQEIKFLMEQISKQPYDNSRVGQSLIITGIKLNKDQKTALTNAKVKGSE